MQSLKHIKKKFRLIPISNQTIRIFSKPINEIESEKASFEVDIQDRVKNRPPEFKFVLKNDVWVMNKNKRKN